MLVLKYYLSIFINFYNNTILLNVIYCICSKYYNILVKYTELQF